LLAQFSPSHAERRFTDAGRPNQSWRQGQVSFINYQPASHQLLQYFALSNPFASGLMRLAEMEMNAIDRNFPLHANFLLDWRTVLRKSTLAARHNRSKR
jgi:hypothetical protein